MEQPFPNELKHLYKEAEFICGFLREITSWQRLDRRNIVSLFDVAKTCEIVFDNAEGLKYAHKQGINNCFGHGILLSLDDPLEDV